ncbi:MAG: flagellar biosynthesis anti-sigma factor FlgM [Phycisphaerae bacterium]|nr:flagellar biosynthesis anti-sigma factor FlgM [Phycisphaerae bacterium]
MVNEIQPTGSSYPADRVSGARPNKAGSQPVAPKDNGEDQVEISELALWRSKIDSLPETRAEKVAAVRQEIAAGTYETEQKWDAALDSLIEELNNGFV